MTFPLPGAPLDQLWSIELLGMKADFFQVALVAGNGNPLQYSCLENPVDRGAWWRVHRITKSQTWLKWLSTHTCNVDGNVLLPHPIQHSSHQPNMSIAYLKCGQCDWGIHFLFYLILINSNLNNHHGPHIGQLDPRLSHGWHLHNIQISLLNHSVREDSLRFAACGRPMFWSPEFVTISCYMAKGN